jgi:hypothetical protein
MVEKGGGKMIFYQYDPEMDSEFLMHLIKSKHIQPTVATSLNENSIWLDENEDIYIFSNDDTGIGLLWYRIHEDVTTLEVKSIYIDDDMQSSQLERKFIDFAVKKAKYLKMSKVMFSIRAVDETQLDGELGCKSVNTVGDTFLCHLM